MLYKINSIDNKDDVQQLEPIPFTSFSGLGLKEKDLENLISENLFEVLFFKSPLMLIFQERQGQPIGDIYALDKNGDLTIFELKRDIASKDAISQLLTYAQFAGRRDYNWLNYKYREHLQLNNKEDESLEDAHRDAFGVQLTREQFNCRQKLIIIGNAADEELIDIVQYWKQQGLSISFAPYRIYKFKDKEDIYFEFFATPYDQHDNPEEKKGVIIDTNVKYSREGLPDVRYMMEKSRIAAFGDDKKEIDRINKGDIVFFYHQGYGVVAAGTVKSDRIEDSKMEEETWYREVVFLTTPPKTIDENSVIPPAKIAEITEKSFCWRGTLKRPFLSIKQANELVEELKKVS